MRTRNLLLAILAVPLFAQNPAVTISVDANGNRHAISPYVYGMNYATAAQLADLNVLINRQGGNNTSRYNWQLNCDNRDNDWYFESIADSSSTPAYRGDSFISDCKSNGAQAMLTIPMIGWVGKLGASRGKLASFSIAKYGAQTGNDWQWFPDAGNGILTSGQYVTGNDPNDANVPSDSTYQQGWMQHIVSTWGPASSGGLRYYILDNEPSIWFSTHRDVHPTGPTMDEMLSKILDYGAKVKATDPAALVVGPEEWGWSGYFYSGYDQQYGSLHGWSTLPDRNNHGGADYLPWLLGQLQANNTTTGKRILDVFSVHYYPQGGEFSNDVSTNTELLRNRSTRSLWDPSYVDTSWINAVVELIPRLHTWVNTYYPGTQTAVTEYSWGADAYINGATAQADILGIFGREGLDIGARWTTPSTGTPTYNAIKMYRNYDGSKSAFGDTSVSATAPNPDNVASFASVRSSDNALTIMVISKYLSGSTSATMSFANFSSAGTAQGWQLTSSNAITRLSDINFSGTSFTATLPAQSITLFVLPPAGTVNQPPTAVATATPTSGTVPLAVSFNGSGSSDPDGTIASYAWAFGDGANGSGATTSHTYNSAGTITAKLTVTDNGGATGSTTVTITVNANTINAPSNLTGSVSSKTVTLHWTDNSSNETGFSVFRALSARHPSFSKVGQVGANVTTYSETVASGTYLYKVQAFNATTTSGYSNQIQLRVR
ncbi:MAG TPA: glycoside hydrolase family 44 protein [Bryobacterales bacterium]|nr:glycoside hydrolase family 44 protein [Bryobacterales bacterium]